MSDTHILVGNVTIESFILFTAATIALIFLAYLCYKAVYIALDTIIQPLGRPLDRPIGGIHNFWNRTVLPRPLHSRV